MTPAQRLADAHAQHDQPPTAQVPGQLALDHITREEWPDGTFGGNFHATAPGAPWTPEQQAAHRHDLEAALRGHAA